MIASIARRYARALIEVAAESGEADAMGSIDAIGVELESLTAAVQSSLALRDILTNPAFSREQRQEAFQAVASALQLSLPLVNLVRLLIDRHRAEQLGDIARVYRELSDDRAGRARAQVRAASALPPELASALQAALSTAVKRQVTMDVTVDHSLIGGAVAQVGSYLFDGSIKGQLGTLRRELKRL